MEAFLAIEEWVVRMGASYWALACLLVFCIIDGLLPILPSETLIIALAALIPFGDGPHRAGDASTPEGTGRQEAPVQA